MCVCVRALCCRLGGARQQMGMSKKAPSSPTPINDGGLGLMLRWQIISLVQMKTDHLISKSSHISVSFRQVKKKKELTEINKTYLSSYNMAHNQAKDLTL